MAAIDRVLEAAERITQVAPKRAGEGRWKAVCPSHADSDPSLSIREGPDGKVLLHDFGGCATEDVVRDLGLEWSDLFADDPDARNGSDPWPPPQPPRQQQRPAKSVQPAHPLDATVLDVMWQERRWTAEACECLRVGFDGERIVLGAVGYLATSVRQDGQAKILARPGSKRGLWPAPEDIEGDECWLCEGEPDAVSGHSAGLPVVAIPGVNGWKAE